MPDKCKKSWLDYFGKEPEVEKGLREEMYGISKKR